MYAFTSYPFVSLTFATFLKAELGFFGVIVVTFVHTHLFIGFHFLGELKTHLIEFFVTCKAGALLFLVLSLLFFLTN